jgi:hypothetical protein
MLDMACLLAAFIVIAVIGWQFWPEDLFFPRLKPAAMDSPVSILVGENIHVSKPHEKIAFTECIITAHPNRVNRLFAASMYWPHRDKLVTDVGWQAGSLIPDRSLSRTF